MTEPIRFARQALLPLASALLVACGGGGDDAPDAADRAVPLQASIPAAQLPSCPAHDESAALVDITAIQGPGDRSPIEDRWVSVRGVVTADFRGPGQFGGFYVQQPVPDRDPATSEGLFVYAPASTVTLAAGDYVQVTGRVREFQRSSETAPLTQIAEVSALVVCGVTPPIKAVNLTLPLKRSESFEQVEGMLVRFEQPLTVTGNFGLGRYGELQLSPRGRLHHPNNHPSLEPEAARDFNARAKLVLDDGSNTQNPAPIPFIDLGLGTTRRAGDVVKGSEGILSSAFGAYRLQPTVALAFEPRNPRPTVPGRTAGALRVASLNVLNLFSTLGQRGAATDAERSRQLDKLVAAVVELDADVLGLMEIENDGEATLQRLVDAVNARLGAGHYALHSPGVPGTDQIQVAMIYRPSRVAPVGNAFVPADPDFAVDGGLRPPVAQRFAAQGNGGGFWFVVNHLKSKGSCPADGASADADRGQGCWNAARVRQAQALQRWVAGLASVSGERDVLLAGDFNAYLREDPLALLRQAGYENLLERLPAEDRYTYVFEGEAGALDHALASAGLASQVAAVSVWHGNADEPPVLDYTLRFKTDDRFVADAYRVSDHDPVIVDLLLHADAPALAPTLRATLPTAGTATKPVEIRDIVATTVGFAAAGLTVDWGDGRGQQPSTAPVASNVYAEPGTYFVRLRLTQAGLQPAELVTTVRVAERPADPAAGLYISEYVEGSGFNKAIELHNPGTEPVDLSAYVLKLFSNGSSSATASLRLAWALAPGAVLVLHHPSATFSPPPGSIANGSVINFNGDDALTLERDGAGVVDQFGQVGFDPGSAWTAGTVTTVDRTLRRKAGVTRGSVPAAAPAPWELEQEWDVFPQNTFDGLGQR